MEAIGKMNITRETEIIDVSTPKQTGLRKSNSNHTTTDFHSTCIKPHESLKGINDLEIEEMDVQAKLDVSTGYARAATLGVEMKGIKRHAHVHEVLAKPRQTHHTKKRYEPLVVPARQSCIIKGEINHTVHCGQPKKGERQHMRAFTHLAYPWKTMAKGYDTLTSFIAYFLQYDCVDTDKYRSYGLFDGMNDEDKTCFATSIWKHWLKEKDKVTIYFIRKDENYSTNALLFMAENGIDESEWDVTPEKQAKVISKMYLHDADDKKYIFDKGFFTIKASKAMYAKLLVKKMSPDFPALVHSTVLAELAHVHGAPITFERVKELVASNAELCHKLCRLQEEKEKEIGNLEKRILTMGEGNVDVHKKWTATKKKLNERDQELALAVMEVEQYRDGEHPMQACDEWKHLGNPGWGGENVLLEKYKKTKEKAIEMWRSQPHFELAYMGQCTAPLLQPPPQKPPPQKPWKRTREVSTGGQDKRRKRSAASIFLTS